MTVKRDTKDQQESAKQESAKAPTLEKETLKDLEATDANKVKGGVGTTDMRCSL